MRNLSLAVVILALAAVPAAAQLASGNIYGTVTDETSAALPGVSVTLTGSDVSQTTTSGSDGRFRFLNLAPGTYEITSTMAGFSTVKRENVVVGVGANVDIPVGLKVATVEETITVSAESPIIDTKKTGTSTTFSQDELSKIPNSRDPWALLRTVPGVVMDRVNVAGNESGQQSSFRAKGALGADAVWNLDGVNITDMAAIGASPTYFDYDAFQEIQISTSGNDIRQPTGGVGLNFVTKRGTNQFHGTLRSYFTHEDLGWSNVPDELASPAPNYLAAGVRPVTPETANHNKQLSDYGFDIGGPILKDRLWFWGSYGKQDIRLVRATPTTLPLIDKTLLKDYNMKVNWQASKSDMVSVLWFNGAKEKFNRAPGNCAGCVEPASATWNQGNAAPEGWPQGLWKVEANHIFNPSLFMNAKYAYYATGFQLFPVGGLEGQLGISPLTGQTYGTAQLSKNVRPQHIANLDANWFASGMGGGHELKFGAGYRWTEALTQTLFPGDQVVGYENSATDFRARVNREGLGINQAVYWSAYVGDTYSRDRLTLNLGVRYDRQTGKAVAADVQGNGAFANLVPGISFAGYDAPFTYSDISPRVGATYALDAGRKTLLKLSYGRYVTQLATGEVGFMNPSGGQGWAEYRWTDTNGDHFAQPGEVNTNQFLASGGGFNPANPTAVASANLIDPDLQAPRTNEIVVGIDRELFPNFAVSLGYTYRKLNRFYTQPRIGMTPADYAAQAAVVGTQPDGTPFSVVTFIPNAALVAAGNSGRNLTNADDYHQTFSGFELSAVKRLSNKWMFRFAASYNDHTEHWDGRPYVVDEDRNGVAAGNPTGLDVDPGQDGGQVGARAAGSGTGDVFINAKWAMNANAMYELPWRMEVAANLFGKQGTPFPVFRNTVLGLDGSQRVLISPSMDDERYSNLWNLDLRVAKNFKFARAGAVVTADLFNVFNGNTELLRQRSVTSNQFRLLTDNLSPRILRLGVRLSF